MDGAHAASARRRNRRAPDDHQRDSAASGDARGPGRGSAGAGGRARASALARADPVAVPERGLRGSDARRRRARGERGVHARLVWRPIPRRHPQVPRGAPGWQRADAAVPAVRHRRRHTGARSTNDRRRPPRTHHMPESEGHGSHVCRARVRRGTSRRTAGVYRPLRRARRVPHLRIRRSDVQSPDSRRDGHHRRTRRVRVHRSDNLQSIIQLPDHQMTK